MGVFQKKKKTAEVDVFPLAEKMRLRGHEAPETTVYLKVNLFTLLQRHAGCLIRALNKNIMWARAFAPLLPALFASTQFEHHHLFLASPSLIVGTSNRIAERTRSDMSRINKTCTNSLNMKWYLAELLCSVKTNRLF